MKIRRSAESDRTAINDVHMSAFGQEQGREIVELVNDLLDDATAKPLLSLVAENDERLVGHLLFTEAKLQFNQEVSVRILALLGVSIDFQGAGVEEGCYRYSRGKGTVLRGSKPSTALEGVELVNPVFNLFITLLLTRTHGFAVGL